MLLYVPSGSCHKLFGHGFGHKRWRESGEGQVSLQHQRKEDDENAFNNETSGGAHRPSKAEKHN